MLVEQPQELKKESGDTQVENCKSEDQTNTNGDFVIIYESNVDENATDVTPKPRPPNQYVETIVYEENSESECSEISETYTKEDLDELCLINSEALDFINNVPSVDTPLCHKQNQMKIKPSGIITELTHPFDRPHFFNSFGSLLSTSLMDILCSNQKNDNFVCYMDNLISHVQYTIEELKRISNGEYLSDRTKQKWIESTGALCAKTENNKLERKKRQKAVNNKIIPPLQIVPCKENKNIKMHKALSDIITGRSKINIKMLNNILHKNVIIEVPKILIDSVDFIKDLAKATAINQGTDKMLQKIITSNVKYPILSCRNFNFSILSQDFNNKNREPYNNLLAIKYEQNEDTLKKEDIKITESHDYKEKQEICIDQNCVTEIQDCAAIGDKKDDNFFKSELNPVVCTESIGSYFESIATISTDISFPPTEKRSLQNNSTTSSSLGCSIHQITSKVYLNIKTDRNLIIKKKSSSTATKIKSPYENNSHVLDERKRKRLLKIRERRQKTKKNKENLGQGLNSETRLILTGKSFPSFEDKENKKRYKKKKTKSTAVKNTKSYMENMKSFRSDSSNPNIINNFTQFMEPLMSLKKSKNEKNNSPKNANENNDKKENNLLFIDLQKEDELTKLVQNQLYSQGKLSNHSQNISALSKYNRNKPPVNTPIECVSESSKSSLIKEDKNSIDKFYTLIKELTNNDSHDNERAEKKIITKFTEAPILQRNVEFISATGDGHKINTTEETSTTQHCNNFEKLHSQQSINNNKRIIEIVAHMPKVTLPPKKQIEKYDKSIRKNVDQHPRDTLKAISDLLHKIDNVQGINFKTETATNFPSKTGETVSESKKNAHEAIKEGKRMASASISSKPVKPENVIKENKNINICKGKKSTVTTQRTEKINRNVPQVSKKENNQNIAENTDTKEVIFWRPRLDALTQPKKTHLAVKNNGEKTPNTTLSAGIRPQRNTSMIPQRIKNILSQNKTSPLQNSTLLKAVPRTQEEAESTQVKSPLSNSLERKLPISESVLQVKNNNALNVSNSLKKNIAENKNRVKFDLEPNSPKRKGIKKLHKFTNKSIKEQSTESKIEATNRNGNGNFTTDVNTKVDIDVSIAPVANNEDNNVLRTLKSVNVILPYLNQSKSDEILYGSKYKIDVFEDESISTAVANMLTRNITMTNSIILHKKHNFLKSQRRTSLSLTRLDKRICPVNSQTSSDHTILKTLAPNRSFKQMFVLQSGDTGSVIVKSLLSQDMKTLKALPEISFQTFTKSNIDWISENLSSHYFPAMHAIKYCNRSKIITKHALNTYDQLICRAPSTEIYIWHDIDKSNVDKEDNDSKESISEITEQCRTVLNDINSPQNAVSDIDSNHSIVTFRSCDRTTSMDILVELINEIRTISVYHANIIQEQNLKTTTGDNIKKDGNKILPMSELGTPEKSVSKPSIYSYFVNNEFDAEDCKFVLPRENVQEESNDLENPFHKVAVCTNVKEGTVNCSTDAPSRLLSVPAKHNVSTSSTFLNKTVEVSTDIEVLQTYKYMKSNSTKNLKCDSTKTTAVDQHLKLKRNILITVYSILVLTVFIALTYPDILARW